MAAIPVSLAAAGLPSGTAQRLAAIDRAYYTQDAPRLERVLAVAAASGPGDRDFDDYARAYGLYRLASLAKRGDPATASELAEAAALLHRTPAEELRVEYAALRSGVLGMMAGSSPLNGIKYGAQSQREGEKALRQAPGNPRALFFAAINRGDTPEAFGGDLDEAIRMLKRAIAAYDQPDPDRVFGWGKADAYVWLGNFCRRNGDLAGAAAAYDGALKVEPDFYWVKAVLIPRLKHQK